ILDFADPVFPPAVATMRAKLSGLAERRPLVPEALMEAAVEQTGLDDFGDLSFVDPLEALCAGCRETAGLSAMGVVSSHTHLTLLLRNRLILEQALKDEPAIHEVTIDRPIFVVGLPRTGSTHLHNLISADISVRTLPYWEAMEPLLPKAERT